MKEKMHIKDAFAVKCFIMDSRGNWPIWPIYSNIGDVCSQSGGKMVNGGIDVYFCNMNMTIFHDKH